MRSWSKGLPCSRGKVSPASHCTERSLLQVPKAKARSANWINNVQRLRIGQCLGFCKSSLIFPVGVSNMHLFCVSKIECEWEGKIYSTYISSNYTMWIFFCSTSKCFAICPGEAHSWKRNLVIVLAIRLCHNSQTADKIFGPNQVVGICFVGTFWDLKCDARNI